MSPKHLEQSTFLISRHRVSCDQYKKRNPNEDKFHEGLHNEFRRE